jgi:hypothetical protein
MDLDNLITRKKLCRINLASRAENHTTVDTTKEKRTLSLAKRSAREKKIGLLATSESRTREWEKTWPDSATVLQEKSTWCRLRN